MARRLEWEKAAKNLRVNREGAEYGYDELPASGSSADKRRYLEKKGYKQAEAPSGRSKKLISTPSNDFGAMRKALELIQRELVTVYDRENSRLMASDVWQRLSSKERSYLRQRFGLQRPVPVEVATEEEIKSTLRQSSLAKRRAVVAVMPRHFRSALGEAARLLEDEGRVFNTRKK